MAARTSRTFADGPGSKVEIAAADGLAVADTVAVADVGDDKTVEKEK